MSFVRTHCSAPVALRLAAVVMAVVAAWGPRVGGVDGVRRVVLMDTSASADCSDVSLVGLVADLGDDDEVCVVRFADGAAAGSCTAPIRIVETIARDMLALGWDASDLAAGLRHAATLAPGASRRFELVVVTDGYVTSAQDELAAAALVLRDAGCTSLSVHDVPTRDLTPRVSALRGPGWARSGQVFSLLADGDAGSLGGRLQLVRDGQVVDARDVPAGPFRVHFPVRLERVGTSVHETRFDQGARRPPPRSHVVVADPRAALVLVSGALGFSDGAALVEALGSAATVATRGDGSLEAALPAHDLVVVVGAAPSARERRLLAEWAAAGGGLLLLGDVEWATVSPLRSAPPDDEGVFLYVALDGSGSMGERWSGRDGRTRDAVVRAALRELVSDAGDDVTLALRRFNDRLLPDGEGPWVGRPRSAGDGGFQGALDRLPPPAGGTLLSPVLREAARLTAGRSERARRVLVFTDGRVGDDDAALVRAVRLLSEQDCGLTLVVDDEVGRDALASTLSATDAEIVFIEDSARLTDALRAAAARARPSRDLLRDVPLRAGPAASGVPGLEFPDRESVVARRWAAPDAGVLVETDDGVPVAALRRHGLGRVAALAVIPGTGWPRSGDRAWLSGLRGAVEGTAAGELRIERDGDRLVVKSVGGARPVYVTLGSGAAATRVLLRPAGDGLLAADLPVGDSAELAQLLDHDGRLIRAVGFDRPAAPEYRDPPRLDTDSLSALAAGPAPDEGLPLRPWLAGLAVLLALAGHGMMARRWSSPSDYLPM